MACLRWPVEEDVEFGKDHFGLDHSQVRLPYTALQRHIVLTMAALAVCAVTAAEARTRTLYTSDASGAGRAGHAVFAPSMPADLAVRRRLISAPRHDP